MQTSSSLPTLHLLFPLLFFTQWGVDSLSHSLVFSQDLYFILHYHTYFISRSSTTVSHRMAALASTFTLFLLIHNHPNDHLPIIFIPPFAHCPIIPQCHVATPSFNRLPIPRIYCRPYIIRLKGVSPPYRSRALGYNTNVPDCNRPPKLARHACEQCEPGPSIPIIRLPRMGQRLLTQVPGHIPAAHMYAELRSPYSFREAAVRSRPVHQA